MPFVRAHDRKKALGAAERGRTPGGRALLVVAGAVASTLVSNLLFLVTGAGPGPEGVGFGQPPAEPTIYTPEELARHPHFGWQPRRNATGDDGPFSWRECFDGTGVGGNQPATRGERKPPRCRERPSDLVGVPAANATWVPNVTLVRAMLRHGRDRDGARFPPPPARELCEDMDVDGNRTAAGGVAIPGGDRVTWRVPDGNKHCFRAAGIRPTGAPASDVVTISPWNHFGVEVADAARANLTAVVVPAPRLLCLVYTMEAAHATQLRAIRDTWAGGCDGFLAFSTRSDPRIPAIHIPHEGDEAYANMWNKVRAIWKYVGAHYLDHFDWFFLGGDDLFVLPHNLRTYLASLAHKDGADPREKAYFVGHRKRYRGNTHGQMYGRGRDGFGLEGWFNTGGAGYALSRAALRKFLAVADVRGKCSRTTTSAEDVELTKCLGHAGVGLTDTRDALGRERFHFWTPEMRYHWDTSRPSWYKDSQREWGLKNGTLCCAPDSVSFHYIRQPSLVRHLHALLHGCEDSGR